MKRILLRASAVVLALSLLCPLASALSVDQALELLEEDYLGEIPAQASQAESVEELCAVLGDPYTLYMTPEQYQEFLYGMEDSQDIQGIGIVTSFTREGLLIQEIIPDSPAQQAGLQAGDLIVAVDGVSCVPAEESHISLISGAPGTWVSLTVLRDGQSLAIRAQRQEIHIPNVQVTVSDNGSGRITCSAFGSDTAGLLAEGLTRYDDQAEVWLLDLRDNPGGYTQAAVDAIGAFSGPGFYLYLRDKTGLAAPYVSLYPAASEDPVVMLVNANTASSAEILAAGLRDQGAGILVGTRTYGKGQAQLIRDETTDPDYFDGDALKITFAEFFSEKGNSTEWIGVLPTLLIQDPAGAQAVAQALCGYPTDTTTDGWLMVQLAKQFFYVDLTQTDHDTLSALFSALPPSAQLWIGENTYYWKELTTQEAAVLLEVDYSTRFFSDVSSSPYAEEINTLGTYDLMRGMGNGKFQPQEQLTRAEACAMFTQLLNVTYRGPSRFTDVPETAWYAADVNAMAALGLVKGVGDNRFDPSSTLTQQEFFTILARIARMLNFRVDDYANQLTADKTVDLSQVSGISSFASWAREGVAVLAWAPQAVLDKVHSTMLHYDLESLSPDQPILREEAAACIYQMLTVTGILTV